MTTTAHNVLVVEDDAAQRRTLCDLIRDAGMTPMACGTGASALEHIALDDVSVAVLDYRLPDLNGIQVLELIRDMVVPVRVILHTAYGSFETARDALNLGAFAFIEKACDPQELVREVVRAVEDAEDSLSEITRFAPDRILQLDRGGTIRFVNQELADRTPAELLETRLVECAQESDRDSLQQALERVFEDGTSQECRIKILGNDGLARRYDCRLGPVFYSGQIVRSLVIARDMTQQEHYGIADRILTLLTRNAREAIGDTGAVRIETARVVLDDDHVEANPGARPGPHLMLSILDTGGGIPQPVIDRMFEPFYTTKEQDGALGLGLAEVYRLVAEAQGHIVLESEPGTGTVFRVYLPLPAADAPADGWLDSAGIPEVEH